jgi:O-antigen/teichoic acid export membrane protein
VNRPARNALVLFSGEAVTRLFGFLTTAVLARRLGVDAFGQIGFAAGVMMYGAVLTDFGLLTTATRSVARDRAGAAALAGTVLPLRATLALAVTALVVLLALALPRPAGVRWLLVIYAFVTAAQSLLLEWLFFGMENTGAVAASRAATASTFFGLVLLLVRTPGQVLLVPVSLFVATLMGAAMLFVLYGSWFGCLRLRFDPRQWLALARAAWPIGTAGVATQVHVNFGLVGLGLLRTDTETGLYSAAFRLVFFLLMLDRVFYTVFLPVVTRVQAQQQERLPELAGTVVRLILCVALPLCAGLGLLARPVLAAVFGPGYEASAPTLQVLAWFLPASMLNSLASYTLVAAGLERKFMRNALLGSLVSVVFGLVGITALGVLGAAVGVLCGEVTVLLLMSVDFLCLVRPKFELRTAAPLVAAAAIVPVCLLLSPYPLGIPVAASVVVYTGLLLVLRGITAQDLGLVRSA